MIRSELGREKMRTKASKKAFRKNFERRLEKVKGRAIARKCLEEMKEK
jgi:DNA replication initiation complex subunit (GINS family)